MGMRGRWLHCVLNRSVFFFNDTATTEIYTLSLHDALPISRRRGARGEQEIEAVPHRQRHDRVTGVSLERHQGRLDTRSEEHTAELQSQSNLVCPLLPVKKNKLIAPLFGVHTIATPSQSRHP